MWTKSSNRFIVKTNNKPTETVEQYQLRTWTDGISFIDSEIPEI